MAKPFVTIGIIIGSWKHIYTKQRVQQKKVQPTKFAMPFLLVLSPSMSCVQDVVLLVLEAEAANKTNPDTFPEPSYRTPAQTRHF